MNESNGKTLDKVAVRTEFAQVVVHGDKLILPQHMGPEAAIRVLMDHLEYNEKKIALSEEYDVFPWDGAVALETVMIEKFGHASATTRTVEGLFGPSEVKPKTVMVEVAYGVKRPVIWGAFSLPGIPGKIQCGYEQVSPGKFKFTLTAELKRKYEAQVREIFEMVRVELKRNSIYRGKALRIRFTDDAGNSLPIPNVSFLDTVSVQPDRLILSQDLLDAVETNLFTPIKRVREMAANNLPIKRGVILGGLYGTGKTLTAGVASKYAVEQGVLYLSVDRADELAMAIEFAKQYQEPACVIFCEDIDRVTDGERDVEMDDLLNIIDGIDSKSFKMIVVLTTNELNSINAAMLRPGRLDAVLEFTAPDAKAIEKLLRFYGDECILPGEDLTEVGKVLAGQIPAVVEEVVKRAKLAQLKLLPRGQLVDTLSQQALLESAKTMQSQLKLLEHKFSEKKPEEKSFNELISAAVSQALTNGAGDHIAQLVQDRLS